MIRRSPPALLAADFASLAAAADITPIGSTTKPNFIVFLSVDVDRAEFGFQGGQDIPTPNIELDHESRRQIHQGLRCGHGLQSQPCGCNDGPLSHASATSSTAAAKAGPVRPQKAATARRYLGFRSPKRFSHSA